MNNDSQPEASVQDLLAIERDLREANFILLAAQCHAKNASLYQAVGMLPYRQRQVLILKYFLTMDDTAVGERLGVRTQQVLRLHQQAISNIQRYLKSNALSNLTKQTFFPIDL